MVRRLPGTFTGCGGQIPMQACTIVARNYLPQARVLARSFRQHHPDDSFTVLVIDQTGPSPQAAEEFAILTLDDLDLPPGEAERMALIYDLLEFATAVKPWLLRRLLRTEAEVVLYFDPDIEIFASLSDLAPLARTHTIVLTPHVLEPIPRDGLLPDETTILAAGIYNLGFIGVGPGSESFLEWWARRLRRESIIDHANMRFTDQRWIDFVPALFPHYILRDPACNVAYWNLHQRKLAQTANGYRVGEHALRFFHYSGYQPDRPEVLSKFQGDAPRVRFADEPAVAAICRAYREKLIAAGYEEGRRQTYRFGSFGRDIPIDAAMRRVYRAALLRFEAGAKFEPPNPFVPGKSDAFLNWLNEPLDSETALVTRYMMGLRDVRPDLEAAFPDPLQRDAAGFHEWFVNESRTGKGCHPALWPRIEVEKKSQLDSPRLRALKTRPGVVDQTIDFAAGGNSGPYRLSGWGSSERRFTWSLGKMAQMGLPLPRQSASVQLLVLTGAFTHRPGLPAQRVEVFAQGRKVAEWKVSRRRWFKATIPAEAASDDGILLLEFRTPDATAPRGLRRDSEDPRELGICLYRLRLTRRAGFFAAWRATPGKQSHD